MEKKTKAKTIECEVFVARDGREFSDQRACERYEKALHRDDLYRLPHVHFSPEAVCISNGLHVFSCCSDHTAVFVRDSKDVAVINRYLLSMDSRDAIGDECVGSVVLVAEAEGSAWIMKSSFLPDLISDLTKIQREIDGMKEGYLKRTGVKSIKWRVRFDRDIDEDGDYFDTDFYTMTFGKRKLSFMFTSYSGHVDEHDPSVYECQGTAPDTEMFASFACIAPKEVRSLKKINNFHMEIFSRDYLTPIVPKELLSLSFEFGDGTVVDLTKKKAVKEFSFGDDMYSYIE